MLNYKVSFLASEPRTLTRKEALDLTELSLSEFNTQVKELGERSYRLLDHIIDYKGNLRISSEVVERWTDLYFNLIEKDIIYSKRERELMITLLSFSNISCDSIIELQLFFDVSKNTIVNDIAALRSELEKEDLDLTYSRAKGYQLKGDELTVRSFAFDKMGDLLKLQNGERLLYKGLTQISNDYYAKVRLSFDTIIQNNHLKIVETRFNKSLYFVAYLLQRSQYNNCHFTQADKKLISSVRLYHSSKILLDNVENIKSYDEEKYYFTILLLIICEKIPKSNGFDFLYQCSKEIINEFQRISAVEITNYDYLLESLYQHLVPAFFRIKFNFYISNPLLEEVFNQYNDLFNILKVALEPFRQVLNKRIPDSEIGFFTVLFGGQTQSKYTKKNLKAVILCPNGISSSVIMRAELQSMFPEIEMINSESINDFEGFLEENNNHSEADLVFSTVPINLDKKVFVVKPLMTEIEKYELIEQVHSEFNFKSAKMPTVVDLLDTIMPYISLNEGVTRSKLISIMRNKINKSISRNTDRRPQLSELLTDEMIQFSNDNLTWQEAIKLSALPLLNKNSIEERYIEAIIDRTYKYGEFINLGKGIALPHARPEEGVNSIGMSLLSLSKPMYILEDKKNPIYILVFLAAIDDKYHLRALAKLTEILNDQRTLEELLAAEDKQAIIELIKREELEG
ncbi:BglG family transcription antiterminator [Aerococcus urinae]|uniref:BglG family transcription antiterminator n=1 Tax=Aerococcus urinae TaxID=1376 RepID=UPI00254F956F|nr:BglG family transcription antiterminator [Aerococcus urinae]MDK6371118.1 BglG family transcription antiterminator [Aerococcus urinae]